MDLKMEVYTPSLELVGLLEVHRSVIWEEKAFGAGSFSVDALITPESKFLLAPDNIIWIEGDTAGIVQYAHEEAGPTGPYLTVKGPNLTGILNTRILWGRYDLSGTPPAVMHSLVNDCCVNPTRGDTINRKIPGLVLLDPPAGGESIRVQKTGGYLLAALEELGAAYGVAFGVRFNPSVPRMEFWTRWGQDRSVSQTTNDPVFYSTELDDVLSSEYSYNAQDYRNVALVAGEGEGDNRTMVVVEAQIPDAPTPPVPAQYTVTLSVDPQNGGTVTGGGIVATGQNVTVTAVPSENYAFAAWQESGAVVSTDMVYSFIANGNRALTAVFASMTPQEYAYTGSVVSATLYPGSYRLEAWGAEGGYRSSASYAGKGGYSVGTLTLTETTTAFVRAGGSGNAGGTSGGFNGGGRRGTYNGGGGASDIRIGVDDYNHRVIVAGGGGSDGAPNKAGGYGGGTTGQSRTDNYGSGGLGGTQTGVSNSSWQASAPSDNVASVAGAYAGFGFGGNGIAANSGYGGAGGGGWYGGSGSMPDSSGDDDRGGAGGSGFVWTGANAPAGFGLTEAHYLTNAQTIDGSQSFASPAGAVETGHSGNGYVRITPVAFYVVTVVSEDAAKGTVSGGGQYESGTQATVTASPSSGYKLSGWYEGETQVSADKTYTFTVGGNRTLTARFVEAAAYTITASIDPAGSGTVTGAGQYQEGATVTLVATPADGHKFSGWQEGGAVVNTNATYTFTAAANRSLVAVFVASRLPAGYTEVEYIQSASPAGISLNDKTAPSNLRIVMDVRIMSAYSGSPEYILGMKNSKAGQSTSYSYRLSVQRTAENMIQCTPGDTNNNKNISAYTTGERIVIDVNGRNKTFSVGSNSTAITPLTYSFVNYSPFFGVPDSTLKCANVKFYSMQVYWSALRRDYVPCVNSAGVVGLYDLAQGAFFGPDFGTFTAGPAV